MYKPVYSRKQRRRIPGLGAAVIGLALSGISLVIGLWMASDWAFTKVLAMMEIPCEETQIVTDVSMDDQPPRLEGVKDLIVYQGDTISYMRDIRAFDDSDPYPLIQVDSSTVDLTKPGCYTLTYFATDEAGNTCSVSASVTVLQKQEGYADLDDIYSLADDLLVLILDGTTNPREQVEAIYRWARTDIQYGGHSDRADWRQTAYDVIHQGQGDCYGYFAATKLMFERLGIQNIDVQKVKNSADDSDHFWSLVSIDGGETYYHFDATPRYGDGDNFCLVTDAFLDAYSHQHKNSHNRDTSLYPATPEDAL